MVSLRACVWTTFLNTSTDWWINVDRSLDDYMRMCHARIHVFNLLLQLERKVSLSCDSASGKRCLRRSLYVTASTAGQTGCHCHFAAFGVGP